MNIEGKTSLFKQPMQCLIKNFFYRLGSKTIKIGFLSPDRSPYTKAMASTRIRVYDVITYLNQTNSFSAELYTPGKRYDVCIFQKYFNYEAYEKMLGIKEERTKVILDINVNYYEDFDTRYVTKKQKEDIMAFSKEVDGIIASSRFLKRVIDQYIPNKNVIFIPESISEDFFKVRKIHKASTPIRLLYQGYSVKAEEILHIKDVLEELGTKYDIEMIFICEKNPEIGFENLKTKFIKYDYNKSPEQLLLGDIKISPRDLNDRYNLGHTFTKIGYPMTIGLPAVASPVDSYLDSPAIICTTKEEWKSGLAKLIGDHDLRNKLAEQGIEYCRNFSRDSVGREYEQYLTKLVHKGKPK